jgi:hypothetical protein
VREDNSELFNPDQSNLYHIYQILILKILQTHIYCILKEVNIELVKSKLLLILLLNLPQEYDEKEKKKKFTRQ